MLRLLANMHDSVDTCFIGRLVGLAPDLLEPYEKSLIRGSYRLARRVKSRELAKKQALRMFVGRARKSTRKEIPAVKVREAEEYLDELTAAQRQD